jgi:hypothetical protein
VIPGYRIEGHAIVSSDDRIADANGVTPPSLHNDADWARFQRALDEAVVTVLGRRGHEAHPNPKRRNRLVLSSSARGIERRADAWWWNPADVSLTSALRQAAPTGGIVAVPGGQSVFDFFLAAGFDAFHLARKASVRIPGGVTLFSTIDKNTTAEVLLTDHDLVGGPAEMLDAGAGVTLTTWHRIAS